MTKLCLREEDEFGVEGEVATRTGIIVMTALTFATFLIEANTRKESCQFYQLMRAGY